MKRTILSLMSVGALALNSHACGSYGLDLELLKALDGSDAELAAAAEKYRARGEAGLGEAIRMSHLIPHAKFATFLDRVARQKDAAASGLFWHTDADRALATARESGRQVLSLRLLGKLDDEFSCANSRLFREVLYPHPEVNTFLRENFVLHWKSVRPVPVMTIDFGDGRTLKRTITGNSAHYVLDQRGRVTDAIPGLYTPEKFLAAISTAHAFAREHSDLNPHSHTARVKEFHQARLAALDKELRERLGRCGLAPVVAHLDRPLEMGDLAPGQWARLAAVQPRLPMPDLAEAANELTAGKAVMERPLIEEVRKATVAELKRSNLELATAEDSVRNEFVLHRRVHERLADDAAQTDGVEALNQWVYAELFLMPDSDPWLGLHTPNVFTGLEDNGIVAQ